MVINSLNGMKATSPYIGRANGITRCVCGQKAHKTQSPKDSVISEDQIVRTHAAFDNSSCSVALALRASHGKESICKGGGLGIAPVTSS